MELFIEYQPGTKSVLIWELELENIQFKTLKNTIGNKCFSPKLSLMDPNILFNSSENPP